MPSYPHVATAAVAIPFNMTTGALEAYNEPERIYHTWQEALLDLEGEFDDDEMVRIICSTALLLQKDWDIHDAISSAVVWERG